MITLHTVVRAAQNQISSELAGEAVILDMSSGKYYGLNDVGAVIWQQIQVAERVENVLSSLQQAFEVEPEQCEKDLIHVLNEMSEKGLIDILN